MRVTNDTTYRNLLRDLQRIAQRLQESQHQVSSGKKLTRPSDDPSAVSDVIRISAEKGEISQYVENIQTARTRLDYSDTVLDSVERMVERVRSLALLSQGNLSSAGLYTTEIEGLRDQILSAANSTFQGQFIFGGSQTQSEAYERQSDGSIAYAGNSDAVKLQIGRASTLQTQLPGSEVFSGAVDIFATVQDLLDALNAGDKNAIVAQTGKLEQFHANLGVARGRLGGLVNVAQTVEEELSRYDLARSEELMRLEDADLAQALTELSRSQTALQAATAVGARISNISILDYLR
jgi:flagellar hook-associated protein 3 FlgL